MSIVKHKYVIKNLYNQFIASVGAMFTNHNNDKNLHHQRVKATNKYTNVRLNNG